MGLTSGSLIGLLFLLTAGLVAGTVWLWPQEAGSRIRSYATRAGLLTSSHIALALAVLVTVNAHFLFFTSWDELLGTGGGGAGNPGVVRPESQGHQKPVTNEGSVTRNGGGLKQLPPQASAITGKKVSSKNPEITGDLEHIKIRGATTGISIEAYVLLPPQYFQPAYARHRFPAVIVSTGYPGNPRSLIRVMHLPELVQAGERSGKVQPMIYIMVRPTVAPPRDTECTDVPGGPQVATFFGIDLPRAIMAGYRTSTDRSGWAIMGDSTGGYCATKVGMTFSDQYSTAVSLSGYFHALKDLTTGDLYGGSLAIRNENDLLWRIQHLPPPPLNLLVTSCKIGERTYPQAVQFLGLAKPPLKADSLILDQGGHNFQTFARMMPGALEWLSSKLVGQ